MTDTDLPQGFKKCKSCLQVKPFPDFGKELKGKFGLKSKCRSCISDKNKTYGAGPGADIKKHNNQEYQAQHAAELAKKKRVKRAMEKYGENYETYTASIDAMKDLE
ncbi:hypothetical protein I7V28_23295 [Lelliottia amnigena]|uniref:hypothetical protein n=1 Tax=Lelliottia TaxID=1330545 RepID=UPI00192C2240|nr:MULTISPECIES: hypothetical protein [Lelliottia]MBL5885569.1 hypothetical protein [Lelliottia aquatilis]MBL5923994.1 hypothetical protein [Lelliottia amnigena]MBL5932832.1 hypothetical protein [Lelliottia amnigena]